MMHFEELKSGAWCVPQLLSSDECKEIVGRARAAGLHQQEFTFGDERYRNNFKHALQDEKLASLLWERLRAVVPSEFRIQDAKQPPDGFEESSLRDMEGVWSPCGVNPHFSVLFYQGGGHFGPHRDGYIVVDKDKVTFLTVLIYLSDRPKGSGGATHLLQNELALSQLPVDDQGRMRAPEDSIEICVQADTAGKGLVFLHDLLHEGQALAKDAPPKWILLSQVIYQRDPDTAPQWTPQQVEARELIKEAEKAEVEGDFKAAMRLYNRAYRLDPSLDGCCDS